MPENMKKGTTTLGQIRTVRKNELKRFRQLVRRREGISQILLEVNLTKEALNALGEKAEKEIMFTIGSGIMTKGKTLPKTFHKTLPGNIIQPCTLEEALVEMDERKKTIEKEMEELNKAIRQGEQNIAGLDGVLAQYSSKRGGK